MFNFSQRFYNNNVVSILLIETFILTHITPVLIFIIVIEKYSTSLYANTGLIYQNNYKLKVK